MNCLIACNSSVPPSVPPSKTSPPGLSDLGTRANADRVFRPQGSFQRFRQDIETMKSSPRDSLDGWIGSEAAIRDPDNAAAVFDAQSWAADARSYAAALLFVLTAMEDTIQQARDTHCRQRRRESSRTRRTRGRSVRRRRRPARSPRAGGPVMTRSAAELLRRVDAALTTMPTPIE